MIKSAETNTAAEATQPGHKKPGGQPGNTNALKHGFYTKNFFLAERRGLQAAEGVVLGDEIGLLRQIMRADPRDILFNINWKMKIRQGFITVKQVP